MQNLQNDLIELLKHEDNLVVDNQLNKNKIIEAALKVEPFLISLLIKNETFKKHFFQEVENVLVFDKIKFQRFVNNKSFLPDSYTAFKNKIGLAINDDTTDNFIKTKNDVVLVWPHKDCILEGGQTKEDQKRNEIFWNETLAPDNVDRLLDAKAFTNFKKYDKEGAYKITELKGDENLILKGNNLLVISSILKTHREKIKLIYIDPPYNTGGDANIFTYNNTFNHSTWLTFMKNRLTIAKNLLTKDGFIAIAIDHYELGYLITLADEIFGQENRLGIVSVVNNPMGRNQAKYFSTVNDFMLIYSKNNEFAAFNNVVLNEDFLKTFDKEDDIGRYKLKNFIRVGGGDANLRVNKSNFWYPIYVSKDLSQLSLNYKEDFYEVYPITTTGQERTWKLSKGSTEKKLTELVPIKEKDSLIIYEKYRVDKGQKVPTIWSDKKYNANHNGIRLLEKIIGRKGFSFPKSLYTVIDTLKLLSNKDDIILDFHAGSGTTAHAVLELNKEDGGNRKFMLVEQLAEHIDICVERNQKVINNDSFVYAELMQYNQYFVDRIQEAKTKEDILAIWEEMQDKAFISYQFNKDMFNERLNAFKTASLETMQHYLIEILDKNQLYVNFSEIEDASYNISDEDKALNYSFYKK
ncbi:DNA methyltransferase [Gaetbulibacter sp. NE]|uniref:DNA methyltransferase n=1 Tax=Gaetbulibacter sp. NE TaxID=2982307 RepID=UPI0021D3E876|nr:site-specific DNA-methyltransferase [Gaetbulibacter sp. NE]